MQRPSDQRTLKYGKIDLNGHASAIVGVEPLSREARMGPGMGNAVRDPANHVISVKTVVGAHMRAGHHRPVNHNVPAVDKGGSCSLLRVLTLLALRDRHGLSPFQGANLVAGCFDLGLTPSARQFGDEKLILRTTDIENFVKHFLVCGTDRRAPHISPLYADLTGMPPALFSVGTHDALLDDSIFMAMRWLAAGNLCDLAIFPGGAHVFQAFAIPLAEESLQRIDAFLQSLA